MGTPLLEAALVAFLPTRDLGASERFFADALGLVPVESNGFANVYVVSGVQLRVTLVPALPAAAHTALGWKVADIAAAVTALRERGVGFQRYDGMTQDGHDVWASPSGARIAWFQDPDGNTLSLQQDA